MTAKKSESKKSDTANEASAPEPGRARSAPKEGEPQGIVIKADEELTAKALSGSSQKQDADNLIAVDEDVWEEFYPEGSKRPSYRLLFPKGTVVRESQLESAARGVRGPRLSESVAHVVPAEQGYSDDEGDKE